MMVVVGTSPTMRSMVNEVDKTGFGTRTGEADENNNSGDIIISYKSYKSFV